MNELIKEIDNRLDEIMNKYDQDPLLTEAMKYSLLSPGKRFRSLLLLSILKDRNENYQKGLDVACAIEMIHAYSLIHDDLPPMDDDDYRRGRLTNHKKYGEGIAILAGDALLTESFNVISSSNQISNENKIKIIQIVSSAAGANGMVAGQALDISSNGKKSKLLLEKIHLHKTHDLILSSFLCGAVLTNMSSSDMIKIKEGVRYVGLAFQVKDDIKDLTDSFDDLGKDLNSDIKNDKITYPKLYGLEKSKEILVNYTQSGLSIIEELFGKNEVYKLIEGVL